MVALPTQSGPFGVETSALTQIPAAGLPPGTVTVPDTVAEAVSAALMPLTIGPSPFETVRMSALLHETCAFQYCVAHDGFGPGAVNCTRYDPGATALVV